MTDISYCKGVCVDLLKEVERLLAERDEWKQAAGAEADERRRAHEEIGLLREGLNSIANNSCCGTCQEAALVAKRTLEGK